MNGISDIPLKYAFVISPCPLGAYVRERQLEGCEAKLVRKGSMGIICVNETIPEEGRKRFAIAHEIGHFILHPGTQLILCDRRGHARLEKEQNKGNRGK